MNFHQRVELYFPSQCEEGFQVVRPQHRRDQQQRARSGATRFVDLKGVENEILAQYRQRRAFPYLTNPGEIALEEILLGHDGYGRGTGRRVGLGQSIGGEVWSE